MVQIIADTTSCLPPQIADRYHIPLVPQLIHFGDQTFTENVDIDSETFLRKLTSHEELPKTAAPPPEMFAQHFKSLVPDNHAILCIHPSTELSGTVRSASVAAQDFPECDIRVIDTRLVASPLGVVVQRAATWAEEGQDIDTIERQVISLSKRAQIFFLVATLDYLAKGGRIGGASALLGKALQLKPLLTLVNGKVEPLGKERTLKKAISKIKTLVVSQYPGDEEGYMTIMHAGEPHQAAELSSYFQERLDIPPPIISDLPPAIVTHAGPGALAVGFFKATES